MNELIVINLDKNHLELHFKREVETDQMKKTYNLLKVKFTGWKRN